MPAWRYVPDSIMVLVNERPLQGSIRPIVSRQFVPSSARTPGDACIVGSMGLLTLTVDTGHKRVFGMDDARITSDLHMIVTRKEWTSDRESCRDEVIRKQWHLVPESEL